MAERKSPKKEDKTLASQKEAEVVVAEKEPKTIAPREVVRFLKIQEHELEVKEQELTVRTSELEIDRQKDDHQFEFAKESLKAQERDREKDRGHEREQTKTKGMFTTFSFVAFLVFLGYLAAIGKDDVAIKLIAAVVTIGSAVLGAYHWGKSKSDKES